MIDLPFTGVVLAGGQSSRMGRDKALLPWNGKPLLSHALEKLERHTHDQLVIGDPAKYGGLHPQVLPDDDPGFGPMSGLVTALRWASHDHLLVLACDVPAVTDELLALLKQGLGGYTDAVVPQHAGGVEPLIAAYHRRCYPLFLGQLALGRAKLTDALALVRTNYLAVEPGEEGWPSGMFRNLNSPADL